MLTHRERSEFVTAALRLDVDPLELIAEGKEIILDEERFTRMTFGSDGVRKNGDAVCKVCSVGALCDAELTRVGAPEVLDQDSAYQRSVMVSALASAASPLPGRGAVSRAWQELNLAAKRVSPVDQANEPNGWAPLLNDYQPKSCTVLMFEEALNPGQGTCD